MKLLRVFLLLSAMMVFVACSNESEDYSYTGALPIPQNLAYELIKQQLGDKQLKEVDIYVSIDMLSAKTKVVSMGSEDIISPDCDSWLFFVDEMPLIANWDILVSIFLWIKLAMCLLMRELCFQRNLLWRK